MPLSINPLSKLVATVSSQISAASSSADTTAVSEKFGSIKADLNAKVGQLSGSLNSGVGPLGGLSGGLKSGFDAAAGAVKTAMGGVSNVVQSLPSAGEISTRAAEIGQSIDKLGLASGGLGTGIRNLASSISGAAGALNNILSLGRGKNLPSGGELFTQTGAFVSVTPGTQDDWRVRINCNFGLFGNAFDRLVATNGVVWPYTPNITVSTKANYSTVDVVHNNQPFYGYKNSQVDDITISGDFSCETETDAEYWIEATTFFKTATKMFFGSGDNVGNPPVVCNLSGYGSRIFNNVPVIIKSFSVTLPSDVNYVKCMKGGKPTWVPIFSEISVVVSPIYNRAKLRQFDLKKFANGEAVGYM